MSHTHTPAEWAEMVSLAVALYAAASVPYFLLVDADRADFDPRPAARRSAGVVRQGVVYAGHDLAWAAASVRHELVPAAVCVRHVVYVGRELARDIAALALLLTTSPKGAMA
jgi:hypothetical protein